VKRHVLELVGALLLCLATFFSYAAMGPISLPLVGTGSGAAPTSEALAPALVSIPKLGIRWPQFPNFCVGLCTREEYLQ
jgi:hypothetical protein